MEAWIQTFTGKEFNVFNPRIKDIDILDIAHGLALKCRYNGHTNDFYSVAEHSVRMCLWNLPGPSKWKLMHDAAEAYIPDMPSPIKERIVGFTEIEDNLLKIIGQRFGLSCYNKNEIRDADNIMGATEARDLMNNPQNWDLPLPPYPEIIVTWEWKMAKELFLYEAKELGIV